MAASIVIAGIALAVSVIVFVDSRVRERRAARFGRRPVLVYLWDQAGQRWLLSNIGLGPALDVVAIQKIQGEWTRPLRMPELAVGDSQVVPSGWVEWDRNPGLGVRYRSALNEQYATRTGDDWSQITEGWREFPEVLWKQIEPHWRYRDNR